MPKIARRWLLLCISSLVLAAAVVWIWIGSSRQGSQAPVVHVIVDAGSPVAALSPLSFGINTAVWDSALSDPVLPARLSDAGLTVLRYPGGSTADQYHWQTNSLTAGQPPLSNGMAFDAFMGLVRQVGAQAMITVNYGSNAAGTGGGDPAEAAAWVRYANVTKGYGVRYWEIGNEVYGNGSYGATWETDLHPRKGPDAYAANAMAFITAMKAADPRIQIGLVLKQPTSADDAQANQWNDAVLTRDCAAADFAIVHWYAQDPGQESDAGLLAGTAHIPDLAALVRARLVRDCGSHAGAMRIMLTETNSVSANPGKQTVSIVNALFLADSYLSWLEHGIVNVDWWDLHNGLNKGGNNASSLAGTAAAGDYGVLSARWCTPGICPSPADAPYPTYDALQMLAYLGHDGQLLATSSGSTSLAVHAVHRSNGDLSILLINRMPTTYHVTIALHGYVPGTQGISYRYGQDLTAPIRATEDHLGATSQINLPPYSLLVLGLHPANVSRT